VRHRDYLQSANNNITSPSGTALVSTEKKYGLNCFLKYTKLSAECKKNTAIDITAIIHPDDVNGDWRQYCSC